MSIWICKPWMGQRNAFPTKSSQTTWISCKKISFCWGVHYLHIKFSLDYSLSTFGKEKRFSCVEIGSWYCQRLFYLYWKIIFLLVRSPWPDSLLIIWWFFQAQSSCYPVTRLCLLLVSVLLFPSTDGSGPPLSPPSTHTRAKYHQPHRSGRHASKCWDAGTDTGRHRVSHTGGRRIKKNGRRGGKRKRERYTRGKIGCRQVARGKYRRGERGGDQNHQWTGKVTH